MPDDDAPGHLGVLGTRELAEIAQRVIALGHSARSPFGERLARFGDDLAALAVEARRRLAEDRLPPGVGTPAQRQHLDAADDIVPPP